jgi:hypothetical protein
MTFEIPARKVLYRLYLFNQYPTYTILPSGGKYGTYVFRNGDRMLTEFAFFQEFNQVLFDDYIFPLYRLSETRLRSRPDSRLNAIAWNLWHTTRAEDLGMNRLVTNGVQVLDEGNWNNRLNLNIRQIGTGMTKAEADQLSDRVDLGALHAYQQAVHGRTLEIVTSLSGEVFSQIPEPSLLARVLHDGEALHKAGEFVYNVYLNHTKGWLVMHLALSHHSFHLGDSYAVLSLSADQ